MNDDYKRLSSFDHEEDTNYSATGMSATIISARVSYVYDLRGPCMVVDTACSSSMLAIHIGCQAIRSGIIPYKNDIVKSYIFNFCY
jgi:acyl transferase domain-containing protein